MTDSSSTLDIGTIVLEEFDRCREKVISRIAEARKLTDTEVYNAGVALNQVVEQAQSYMTDVNERFTDTADDKDDPVAETLSSIQVLARHQESLVSSALENLDRIARAGERIQELSGASRLLALNARVESARFGGEGGRAFNVIADEMRELSQSVESTNMLVSDLAEELQRSLPKIKTQNQSMSDSVQTLVQEVDERKGKLQELFRSSVEAGGEALEVILGRAREGLSHLQFQDVMIQDLEGIERLLTKNRESMAKAFAMESEGSLDENVFLGTIGADMDEEEESGLDAGEVLLF